MHSDLRFSNRVLVFTREKCAFCISRKVTIYSFFTQLPHLHFTKSSSSSNSPNTSGAAFDRPFVSLGNSTGALSLLESTHAGFEETATSSGYETVDSSRLSAFDEVNQGSPPILVNESANQFLSPFKANLTQETAMDTKLENKLLRSEVSSLSQEVSDLLKRNHKVVEENKELRGQVSHFSI